MSSPIVRAQVSLERMGVSVAMLTGMHPGIDLRWQDGEWHCTAAQPVVWFGEPFLSCLTLGFGPWELRSGYVRLRAVNGEWVWRLTDERAGVPGVDGGLEVRKAAWPD